MIITDLNIHTYGITNTKVLLPCKETFPRIISKKDILKSISFSLQFEMLTGALPFQGANRKETMTQILKSVFSLSISNAHNNK